MHVISSSLLFAQPGAQPSVQHIAVLLHTYGFLLVRIYRWLYPNTN